MSAGVCSHAKAGYHYTKLENIRPGWAAGRRIQMSGFLFFKNRHEVLCQSRTDPPVLAAPLSACLSFETDAPQTHEGSRFPQEVHRRPVLGPAGCFHYNWVFWRNEGRNVFPGGAVVAPGHCHRHWASTSCLSFCLIPQPRAGALILCMWNIKRSVLGFNWNKVSSLGFKLLRMFHRNH